MIQSKNLDGRPNHGRRQRGSRVPLDFHT